MDVITFAFAVPDSSVMPPTVLTYILVFAIVCALYCKLDISSVV